MAKNFTKSEIEKAIAKSGGIISTVAKRLKCDWGTARKYINEFNCNDALQNEKEGLLDLAEGMLLKNIKDGDTPSIFYYLNNQGQSRGYNVRQHSDITTKVESFNITINPFAPIDANGLLNSNDNEHSV